MNYKRFLLSMGLTLAVTSPVKAVSFPDVTIEDWFYPYVNEMAEGGYVYGQDDNTFAPNAGLTVAEFATMISNGFYGKTLAETKEESMVDWWSPYMNACVKRGGMVGTAASDYFYWEGNGISWGSSPNEAITRFDMASMIFALMQERGVEGISGSDRVSILENITDTIPEDRVTAVTNCFYYGFLTGYDTGEFLGEETLSRAEASAVLSALVRTTLFSTERLEDYWQAPEPEPEPEIEVEPEEEVEEEVLGDEVDSEIPTQAELGNWETYTFAPSPTSNAYVYNDGIFVQNNSNFDITPWDLTRRTSLTIDVKDTAPQILIYHSHATEAYTQTPTSQYVASGNYRSRDDDHNITAVGAAMAKVFEEAGFVVIHDRSHNDYPSYSDSYVNSKALVADYLAKYPSIQFAIDVHRDGLEKNGVPYQLVSQQGDETIAQVMLYVSSEVSGYPHPYWRENFALALTLQDALLEYGDFARPITLSKGHYNQQQSTGLLLLEVGNHGNTLEQGIAAGVLFAETAVATLKTGGNSSNNQTTPPAVETTPEQSPAPAPESTPEQNPAPETESTPDPESESDGTDAQTEGTVGGIIPPVTEVDTPNSTPESNVPQVEAHG